MAPDRGGSDAFAQDDHLTPRQSRQSLTSNHQPLGSEPTAEFIAERSAQPQFTLRALVAGLLIGILIAFSNTYFGLQTGWISGMAMPSALIGFAYFKGLRALLWKLGGSFRRSGVGDGFSEVENVLVQTVAGAVGIMPLGCGFVAVIPALQYLLKPNETPDWTGNDTPPASTSAHGFGGLEMPLWNLILWALGICFFGVIFAVPLRKEVIVREKLRFPTGTATALMIGVLHGGEKNERDESNADPSNRTKPFDDNSDEESQALLDDQLQENTLHTAQSQDDELSDDGARDEWQSQIWLLTYSFLFSGSYTLISYFIPQLHSIPILGNYLSKAWLWNLNPSPAYIGQGIVMGPATTTHMFFGAVLGWAVLSPLAKYNGWASGEVADWESGSKGWIVWVSLAIMLADAIVSLVWLILRPVIWLSKLYWPLAVDAVREKGFGRCVQELTPEALGGYKPVRLSEGDLSRANTKSSAPPLDDEEEYDAPPEQQISVKTTLIGIVITVTFCIVAVRYSFRGLISIPLTILAMVLSVFLSVMAVRATGETDLNPVSGISKLTQLIFALVTPKGSPNAMVINILAGGISEAGALQAGELLQDLKCGHLLGASPLAQFYGQLIGTGVGSVISALVYKLYTSVYQIPGGLFQVPTGYVWVFTARLVTGQGLPDRSPQFAIAAAAVWALLTVIRIYGQSRKNPDGSKGAPWVAYVPGGIAVAVGMYNTPSFTLARFVGGMIAWWWTRWRGREETTVIVLASGLILGEGILSIVNLALASAAVPHL